MRETRLSIVTPSLNQAAFIEETILSVLSQLGPHDSYVVVDGGSSDGTHEILQKYRSSITRVYIHPGESQAEALQFGFQKHPATYAAYLNSDDLLLPNAISIALAELEKPKRPCAVYGHRAFIDETSVLRKIWHVPPHSDYLMKRWDYIPQETCFWRYASMIKGGGIDVDLKFAIDFELFVRLMQLGSMHRVNRYLGAFRVHSQSKTSTINRSIGRQEVDQIQQRYNVERNPWDRTLGALLREWIQLSSRVRFNFVRKELSDKIKQATRPLAGS